MHQKECSCFLWPNLRAFKVVLSGSRLGKPGVFAQRGFTNEVRSVILVWHSSSVGLVYVQHWFERAPQSWIWGRTWEVADLILV